jgi:hypothetical protein
MNRLLPLLLIVGLTGCNASSDARVTFAPNQPSTHKAVYESFPGAYISSSRDGEYDVVLVNDTLRSAEVPGKKRPLVPVAQPPIQQAMLVHVFWRPVSGAMMKESSITNAIVHWYVFSGEASGKTDMLHYQGAAFVKLNLKGDTTFITIGDGQIASTDKRGQMKDPIGPAKVTAEIMAVKNDARVKELTRRIQEKAAGTDRFWTEAQSDTGKALP